MNVNIVWCTLHCNFIILYFLSAPEYVLAKLSCSKIQDLFKSVTFKVWLCIICKFSVQIKYVIKPIHGAWNNSYAPSYLNSWFSSYIFCCFFFLATVTFDMHITKITNKNTTLKLWMDIQYNGLVLLRYRMYLTLTDDMTLWLSCALQRTLFGHTQASQQQWC